MILSLWAIAMSQSSAKVLLGNHSHPSPSRGTMIKVQFSCANLFSETSLFSMLSALKVAHAFPLRTSVIFCTAAPNPHHHASPALCSINTNAKCPLASRSIATSFFLMLSALKVAHAFPLRTSVRFWAVAPHPHHHALAAGP